MEPKLPTGIFLSVGRSMALCSFIVCSYDIFMLDLSSDLVSPQQLYTVQDN